MKTFRTVRFLLEYCRAFGIHSHAMNSMAKAIRELEARRDQIESALRTLRSLSGVGTIPKTGRTHHMSAAGRARIAAAARKRWAKLRAAKG